MRKLSLYLAVVLLAAFFAGMYSCTKKVDGVNNDQVIETPYSLFFSDTAGALFNSTDGKKIQKVLFRPDGFPCRAICTDNDNILWAKTNLYISTDNGVNFNQAFDSLASYPFVACDSIMMDLNQSMIINIPEWNMAFTVSNSIASNNYVGVVFSLGVGGIRGSWWFDLADTAVPPATISNIGNYGSSFPIQMTSFAYLTDGTLCGYDALHNRNFFRTQHSLWQETTGNPDSVIEPVYGSPMNRSGARLPHRDFHYPGWGTPTNDTGAWYSYGHINKRLIAIDNKNCSGVGAYFSDDYGRNWTPYTGLPSKRLLCIASPFEEISLIGTDSAGLYYLNNNTGTSWQLQTNNGLGNNLVIRNIAFHENIYKNGVHKKFIYLATSKGIYQSTNGGLNWTLTIPGNYVAVY